MLTHIKRRTTVAVKMQERKHLRSFYFSYKATNATKNSILNYFSTAVRMRIFGEFVLYLSYSKYHMLSVYLKIVVTVITINNH
jgi:hypothetical protein